jgi:signal transduction histidine kinase/CheY-like chemotaxis protein
VTPLRVLFLEDDDYDAELAMIALEKAGYRVEVERVATRADFLRVLDSGPFDLIFADYRLPGFTGLEALELVAERGMAVPFILISGTLGEEQAIEALKSGATDYVLKTGLSRLGPVVRRALAEDEAKHRSEDTERALREEARISDALALVGQELIASLGAPDLLERLCAVTAEVLGFDSSQTLLRDPNDGSFRAIAGYGLTPAEQSILRTIRIPAALTATLLSRLETADVAQASAPSEMAPTDGTAGARQLCMALRSGDRIIGIQVASRRRSLEPFSAVEQRIAGGIARLTSLVLEHDRLRHELERANRLKSDFLATMSHELRTPLHIIIGYVDSLLDERDEGHLNADHLDRLERISHSAIRLLELINSTLEISRLETSQVPLTLGEVRLLDLLDELRNETLELQERSGLAFEWRVDPAVPPIQTDRVKLGIVVKNLIDNAVKFTPSGSVTVEVTSQAGAVGISVSDTGIGIPAESRSAVFESFFQVEAAMTRSHGGVGLGLYIVHLLLELLGGRIEIESEPGSGSTFRVWLPLQPPAAA